MAKHEVSEIFFSIEGEAEFTGHPTAYIRFGRCNFTCAGFNGGCNQPLHNGYAQLTFHPKDYTSIMDIPPITKGCDSQYSVNPEFAHMWKKWSTAELVDALLDLLPNRSWRYPNGNAIICSLTGGEPVLRAKFIPDIFNHPGMADCKHYLVETNCAVPLTHTFIGDVNQWLVADTSRKWTWSNSPKLSASGEPWDKAIRPDIAMKQRLVTGKEFCDQVTQYFKFVCGDRDEDFNEVALAMDAYYAAGIPRTTPVYIMPESCISEQQSPIAANVAKRCMELGHIFCYRVHLPVFNNAPGT